MFYQQQQIEFKPEEIIMYLRKSRSDDPLKTVEETLENHETRLDEWCEKNLGEKIPKKNRFYELVSGETIKDRPEVQKVLNLIEKPKYKAVLIIDIQRLSRGDLEDAGRLIKLFRYTNTIVITPERLFDLRNEYDRRDFENELKRGNDYLEYFKKISNNGRLLSVSQGNYIGSVPPYGYKKVKIKDGKKECPTLEIKDDEANVVRMIFEMYVNEDLGRTSIAHRLDALGIKPPKGKNWSPSALKDMLENVHYIGKVKWNWRKVVKIVEDGEIKKTAPKAKVGEYLVFDGKHEAIISEELFLKAREKQGRNHRAKAKTKVRNPLAGLVWCQCGRAMSYRTYLNKGVERNAPRLICDNQAICHTSSCLYSEMLDKVISVLKDCIADFEVRIDNNNEDAQKLQISLVKQLETKLKELEKKEISQWEKYSEEGMPKEIFDKLNAKVLKEKEDVKNALCEAKGNLHEPEDYKEKLLRFQDALNALTDPKVSAQKKNRLLKACIERIDYKREKAQRIKSQQTRYYDKELKITRHKSPLNTGGNWTNPPIEIDVKLKV